MSHDEGNDHPFAHLSGSASDYRPAGDFYLEPDTTTRSVVVLDPDDVTRNFALDRSFKGTIADGDYYHEPIGMHKACQPYPSCLEEMDVRYSSISCNTLKTATTARFTAEHVPFDAPQDSLFQFAVTTIVVIEDMPYVIGNVLLDFLTDKVTSTLVKPVNHNKFAFKADVFEQYMMATVKVRVFRKEDRKFAIEFQRRQGDTLVFNSTFQKAVQYATESGLNVITPSVARAPVNFAPPPLPEQQASVLGEAELTPLLDMAAHIGEDSLQAEAAAALTRFAEDSMVISKLCTPRVFQTVKTLLNNSFNEVAYPTARLAKILMQQQEAGPYIIENGILPLILEQVQSKTTSDLVREELAQALQAAAYQSKAMVSLAERKQLADALGECTRQLEVAGNHTVVQSLRSAQMALSA